MNTLNLITLQAQAQGSGGSLSGILMIVAMVAIFYFFMIRPQSKKQKELKRQREAMTKGDRVVTSGGIYGRINKIEDTTVDLEVAPNVSIKVSKESVFPVVENAKAEKK